MPDPSILYIGSTLVVLAIIFHKELLKFADDCSDGNVTRLIRGELEALNAWEAKIILARMERVRVA